MGTKFILVSSNEHLIDGAEISSDDFLDQLPSPAIVRRIGVELTARWMQQSH